ncbi:site-specific integrase [Planomonospora parontospora]|uniref:site-specific integrase n=1 Tax=Planomonospora parontospora TaxID=58119 RepID=UPI00167129F4|nr:tyrosine-type recombinase/integrase [Planomonospora parontospora]GGL57861.1 integrase [Planomonospora parontospora subsp. antibiotica]GII20086.1 integrase [Planomonospora parontospora subsp. antibiotica]
MNTSYKVKFWGIRTNTRPQGVGKKPRIVSHTVRWTVDNGEKSSTFKTKGLAESFLSDLRQAARNGEAFDLESGLPGSMVKAKDTRTWYSLAVAYVHAWWPHSAAKTREGMTDSLAYVTPVLTGDVPGRPDDEEIRRTLLEYSFVPEDRRPAPSPKVLRVVRWLEAASLPLSALEDPQHTRAALEAISLRLDGTAAAASTYRRKRAVFHQVLEYAVELGELSVNPIHKVKFRKVKATGEIDRRSVVSPEQARRLLVAVTYAGRTRGPMMAAMFACMYFAGLRPAEAAGLREANCDLPATGWGVLTLETTRPESNTRYTDSGEANDERGLKHRGRKATRRVPIPPELVTVLREHIDRYGVAEDGRLFRTRSGKSFPGSTVSMVWKQARMYAFTPDQVASPLAGRPYDLRHAAVSLWLNAGVHAPEVAERAGHGVDVLLRVYAKCIDGQHETANKRIMEALTT